MGDKIAQNQEKREPLQLNLNFFLEKNIELETS